MTSEIKRAKTMLPNIPDEVFDLFLSPLITNNIGWPFQSLADALYGTDWQRIFYPFTLLGISQLVWERHCFFVNKDILWYSPHF
jgi:hypothetical protein